VVFTGPTTLPLSPSPPPIEGAGTRMMWYPDKAAFRAGAIFPNLDIPSPTNYWDKANIGIASFASGFDTKASGEYSTAMGYGSFATGISSTSIGHLTNASGNYTMALGYKTTASETLATAIGNTAIATGFGSISIGTSTFTSGWYSTAIGYNTSATGRWSTAMCFNTLASGHMSFSIGENTTASGETATSMGYLGHAKGDISVVTGESNIANGYSSLVTGLFNDSLVTPQTAVTATTPLFIVGNGNSIIDRSNAFVVLKNGNVAIGGNGNPVNRLHITGGTSASLSSTSGYITTGLTNSTNMVIDNNGFQVRSNGAASSLNLQTYGGNVSIGNTGVPAYQLEITGTAGKPGGGSWSNASDRRLKQNINPYTQGLQQLLQINPVTYQYNEKSGFDTKPEYVGIIAQDLQKIAPYMVSTVKRKDAEYLSVDNSAMTYMLINAVKEQQQQIELLKAEIELLKKANK
jgi:Chaperone of endosialidase/Head domain of trimeric autotransporter adhesin